MTSLLFGAIRAKDRLQAQAKEAVGNLKPGLSKFKSTAASDAGKVGFGTGGRDTFVNEPMMDTEKAEAKRRHSTMSTRSHYEPAELNPYHNTLLNLVERNPCCGCSKRWQLAIMANIGFIIVFGIRCNFGAARTEMTRNYTATDGTHHPAKFDWTPEQKGLMESSFFYGYIVTQLPGGFLAAKVAPNKLFGLAIGAASFANLFMPTACTTGVMAVVFVQICQGLVQGVSYPAMHGVWRYWAPPMERSKLATTAFTGSYAGAVVGLPLSAALVVNFYWASPFYFYGVVGLIWTVFWFALTFERPATHPTISPEEKKFIEDHIGRTSAAQLSLSNIPWKAIFTSKPVWAIIIANFARSWTFYLLLNHQIAFMSERLHMDIRDSGFWAAAPHAVMACMVLIGGQLADYLRSNNIMSTTNVRKLMNCGGFGGEAFFLLFVAYAETAPTAIFCLILAVGSSGFAISGFNVNHLDIAPRYAALLMGISNGVGTFSGMICPFVTEHMRQQGSSGWKTVFLLASAIHFTGVIFYGLFASGEQQPWAEPPDEYEPALGDDFALKAEAHAGYGSTKDVQITPLPNAEQLHLINGNTTSVKNEWQQQ